MNCLVTAGPTFEPLDHVRRLTNRSTGRLGCALAEYLHARGHAVTLLLGEMATSQPPCGLDEVQRFTSTADLQRRFEALAGPHVQAVFHAAAVSDFAFGRIWRGQPGEAALELRAGKFSTAQGPLLAELVPTPKLIAHLHEWFPSAFRVGWKYEVDGTREDAIEHGREQIAVCHMHRCVVNGPAYGEGFGVVDASGQAQHCPDAPALFRALEAGMAEFASIGQA